MIHNCYDCEYAVMLESLDCKCNNKRNSKNNIIIKHDKLHINCPAHPKNFQDTRYVVNGDEGD